MYLFHILQDPMGYIYIYIIISLYHYMSMWFPKNPAESHPQPALRPVTCPGIVASWDHPEELLQGRQQPGKFQRRIQTIQTLE